MMASGTLSDDLYAIAYNIEDTLIQANAKQGEDYTRLDILLLALPFALRMFEKGCLTYDYPAVELVLDPHDSESIKTTATRSRL